ncbi:MAG: hypothetical protein M1828_000677 [Chrysothrix sp. TS-e1954]|nr:MAG: hypothetical protein M1828_000677 [Chrysothrix sp. TS-e1954]
MTTSADRPSSYLLANVDSATASHMHNRSESTQSAQSTEASSLDAFTSGSSSSDVQRTKERYQDAEVTQELRAASPTRPAFIPGRSLHNIHRVNEEDSTSAPTAKAQLQKTKPVSWGDLPRKSQLAILTLTRLAEPVAQTSLFSYMYFMLQSFDASLSSASIASQAGMLAGSFTAAQCFTAVIWGRMADKESVGRKNVLIIGLVGTLVSVLGFGFSTSFYMAMFFRSLGGALNGNVSVMRTMVSEMVVEKKYQPKAFLIMPVTFNVGVLIGPLLGGWLQDPVKTFPGVVGPGSAIGGPDGVQWLQKFPYALPNLVTATFLFFSALLVCFGLEETHIDRKYYYDYGIEARRSVQRLIGRLLCRGPSHKYSRISSNPNEVELATSTPSTSLTPHMKLPIHRPKLPYRRIWTRNVLSTFLTHGLLAAHLGAFGNTYFLFLSTPRFDPAHPIPSSHTEQHLPFRFTGGLGLPPPTIGFAVALLGAFGLTLQFGIYSRITHKLGIVRSYRYALLLFPITYAFSPYLAILPTTSDPPHAADGSLLWLVICLLLLIQVVGRTFALPSTQILVNNCTPHPSVLGTVHGHAQSVSAGARTIGPVLWSTLYGVGLRKGVVGMAWWILSIEAILACLASRFQYEGSGHEIWLEGDEAK